MELFKLLTTILEVNIEINDKGVVSNEFKFLNTMIIIIILALMLITFFVVADYKVLKKEIEILKKQINIEENQEDKF